MKTSNMIFVALFLVFTSIRAIDYGVYLTSGKVCVFNLDKYVVDGKVTISGEDEAKKCNEIESHESAEDFPWVAAGKGEGPENKVSLLFIGSKGRIATQVALTSFSADDSIDDEEKERLANDINEEAVELCYPGQGGIGVEEEPTNEMYKYFMDESNGCLHLSDYGPVIEVDVMGTHIVAVVENMSNEVNEPVENVTDDNPVEDEEEHKDDETKKRNLLIM